MKALLQNMPKANLSLLLGAKAEVVLGTLLVARNRAVRLVCLLVLFLGAVLSVNGAERFTDAHQPITAFSVVGTLAAVAGSRLFAPGAAYAASRRVATVWWLVPIGRLVGALLVVLPVAAVVVFALELAETNSMLLGICATVFAAAVASLSFSLATVVGSSAATALTLATTWAGVVPSTSVHAVAERWPVARYTLFMLWDTLPLPWRADRFVEAHRVVDALVLVGWVTVGILVAGWASNHTALFCRRNGVPS